MRGLGEESGRAFRSGEAGTARAVTGRLGAHGGGGTWLVRGAESGGEVRTGTAETRVAHKESESQTWIEFQREGAEKQTRR